MKYFFVETYGCQMNKADSTSVIENLKNAGFVQVNDPINADFVIINTCSVRKTAESRIWGRLGFFKGLKAKKNLTTLVMGCMSERVGEDFFLSNHSVDIVVGNFYKDKIPSIIHNYKKGERLAFIGEKDLNFGYSFPDEENPKKAFVTISHGCNNFCSYCIVPYLRGREKSRPSKEIIDDIARLADKGVIQVTLLGQNVNSYGKDSDDISFSQLLKKICRDTNIGWIKYLSSHPKDLDDDLIETIITEDKVSKWLHLAVQSGSNNILQKMNRHYTIESYIEKVEKLKKNIRNLNITTDIIVGFPGETKLDFVDTVNLVKQIQFDDAYMYKYNVRENTHAANQLIDDVPEEEKLERLATIINLQREISYKNKQNRLGNIYDTIAEKESKKNENEIFGFTKEELAIVFNGDKNDFHGIVKLKATKIEGNTLFGEKI